MEVQSVTSSSSRSQVIKESDRIPDFSSKSIRNYCKTRFTTFFINNEEFHNATWNEILNPFHNLSQLSGRQWNFYFVGYCGWTWDAFDYFSVALNVTNLAEAFDVTIKDVTWGITVALMLRSVGAVIFGIWGDRCGRKWPYIFNLALLLVLQIGLGFVQTYGQFLAVRALFGIAMGGMYGNCVTLALEDCPVVARGVISGMFQEGYSLGYLLGVIFQRAITDTSVHSWRALCWFSAGPPVIFMVWRYFLPETDTYIQQKRIRELNKQNMSESETKFDMVVFKKNAMKAFKKYWLISIYSVILLSGFNFMSHGSQDLYPTMLTKQLKYSNDRSTVTNSVANLGALFGGIFFGQFSTYVGRRFTMVAGSIFGGAMIYPWAFVRNSGINAGAFFLQAAVLGAWGVIPIHLSELAPPEHRSFFTGFSYQLGNLCSSASSTIESTIGLRFPLPHVGKGVYDYAKVMAIFMGCVFVFVIIIVFMGPEYKGADLNTYRVEDVTEVHDDLTESIDSESSKPLARHIESV